MYQIVPSLGIEHVEPQLELLQCEQKSWAALRHISQVQDFSEAVVDCLEGVPDVLRAERWAISRYPVDQI